MRVLVQVFIPNSGGMGPGGQVQIVVLHAAVGNLEHAVGVVGSQAIGKVRAKFELELELEFDH